MTYTEQINHLNEVVEPTAESETTTTEKLKFLQQEGTQRSKRVAKILQTAFSEAAAEFKEGCAALSPLAKEVTAETVAAAKENGHKLSDTVNQIWQEAETGDLTERIIQFIRTLATTAKDKLFPQLKNQANKLDSVLNNRYGDRYTQIKEPLEVIRTWYVVPEEVSSTTPNNTDAVETPTIEVESEVVQ